MRATNRTRGINQNLSILWLSPIVALAVLFMQIVEGEILRWDRFQHGSLSLLMVLAFYYGLKGRTRWALPMGALGALVVGLCKEGLDPQIQNFDIAADIFGVFLGILIVCIIPSLIPQKRLKAS